MSDLLTGATVTCPACWEQVTFEFDLSVPEQTYIEDCPVCCQPMQIHYRANAGELDAIDIEAA